MATPRSIASVTISFGLVAIPVKVYTAHDTSGDVRFHLVHAKDGGRLRQQYVCVEDDEVVPRDEMARGFEVSKDQLVIFTPDELKAIEEPPTQSIEIAEFLPLEAVDPIFYEKTYYLAPDKGGAKPYALLARALADSTRCAVGRWAARGKQYLVLLRVVGGVLTLQQLHYANELRQPSAIEVSTASVSDAELKLARQLIDAQTTDEFRPEQFRDEVRTRIDAAIQQKVDGQEIKLSPARPASSGNVVDLMEALRNSLEQRAGGKSGPKASPARRPPTHASRGKIPAEEGTRASPPAAARVPSADAPAKTRKRATRK